VKRPKVANRKGPANEARLHPKRQMTKERRLPIDQLLNYWIDVSKRPAFTLEDYVLFFKRAEMTVAHFSEAYPRMSDKFFDAIQFQVWDQDRALKAATGQNRLANFAHAHMKDVAKRFIPRIKKWFAAEIVIAIHNKTPLQDAKSILAYSTKLTYLWAAGIIASNHLAILLIRLMSRFGSGGKQTDDIMTLYANLKNRTTNRKLKAFLVKSHRRFEDADKIRNRCAHVNEGEPTKQEIEQSIALAQLLQKYITIRRPAR
jgi:hypothetical protein